jgi:hypothetical protein
MVDSEREVKRLNLTSVPGIASGIISASKSVFDESVAFQLKSYDCGLCEFFGAAETTEEAILAGARSKWRRS